jgi:hypothetical protein
MTSIVLGDTTDSFASTLAIFDTPDGYQYTAPASAVISSIEAKVKCNSSFSIELGVYTDVSGAPGALLGSGTVSSGSTAFAFVWLTVSGLSIPITAGQTYWLAATKPTGGPSILLGKDFGFTIPGFEATAATGALADPFGAGGGYDAGGAVGIRAFGDLAASSISTGLEFHVTGIIPFGGTTAPYYGRIADPSAGEVVIPLNDSRTASVTVSAFDPVVETLAAAIASNDLHQIPYETHLKAYYNGHLVFWGPVKVLGGDFTAGTLRLDAVDMSLRLIKHFIREGDTTLEGTVDATTGEGSLPISHTGMRLLRDAGTTSSFPPLGIDDGTNSYAPATVGVLGVRRGDQVWNLITQMSQALGPDFELEPRDDSDGYYCQLNTYDRQGADVSGTVQMHYGTGRQNLESLSFVEGEEYVNLAHVLDKDLRYRRTRSNATGLARTGPYIYWDTTDFDTSHTSEADSEAVLDARADDILDAYSEPLAALSLTLFPDAPGGYRYLDDYKVGDTIGVAGRVGFLQLPEAPYRVMKVTLSKDGESDRQALEVVADRAVTIDGSDT